MYGDKDNVRLILGISREELTDAEIDSFLALGQEEIHSLLNGTRVYDGFILKPNMQGIFNKTLRLYYKPMATTTFQVYRNGVLIDPSLYTVNIDNSTITLSQDLSLNTYDKIVVVYEPEILNRLAELYAVRNILLTRIVNLPQGVSTTSLLEKINDRIREIEKYLTKQPYIGGWVEHMEEGGVW